MSFVYLRQSLGNDIRVDRVLGVIANVSVVTMGEAHGHGAPPFEIDATMLQQVADAINKAPKPPKSRMTHPEVEEKDGLPLLMGKIKNARVEGNKVLADFHAGRYADQAMLERLYSLAEDAPEDAGLSIVIGEGHFEEANGKLLGRVTSLFAVDWVGTPAANPAGMLSQTSGETPKESKMNDKQKEYLSANGLPEDTTEEKLAELSEAHRAALAALADVEEEEKVELAEIEPEKKAEEAKPANLSAAAPVKPAMVAGNTLASLSEVNEIATLAGLGGDWAVEMVLSGKTPTEARKIALSKKAGSRKPIVMPTITGGEDRNIASLTAAIPDAIMLRANHGSGKGLHERAKELSGISVLDMARVYFGAIGVPNTQTMSRAKLLGLLGPRAFHRAYPSLAQSTDSFDNILADTINKSLRAAYMDAPSSWQLWARRTTNPDFKTITRAALSESPNLVSRQEGQPIEYTTLGDQKETYQLVEYIGGIRLTRQAIINDDMDAFGRIPQMQASAAKRKEDDVAYAIITANAALNDTGNLFNATAVTTAGGHANLTTGSGTAMSIASLEVAFNTMFVQKGPKLAAFLELVPKFLLVPSSKKATADQLINSTVDPAANKGHATNPFANSLTVIPSARLNANSATAWYLMADHRDGQIDTVEVCFLQDEPEPALQQETDFDTDDQKFKVRHIVAAKAIDFRGMYKNDGA